MSLWTKAKKLLSNPKNIAAIAAAPLTAGASLALVEDNAGNSFLDNITGAKSAREQNERQKQLQDEANAFNKKMQEETNELTVDLSNTAHQREVADLKAAGLNPVLSAMGSGASTPTLGTATAVAPTVQNEMPGGYLAQAGQIAQIANLAGTAQQAVSQSKLNDVNAKLQPQIAKADIASKFAQAGSAKATADYTETMKQFDMAIKDAEEENIRTNTYRNKNLSKGEQTREWIRAITGGASNVGQTALTAKMASNMSPIKNQWNRY